MRGLDTTPTCTPLHAAAQVPSRSRPLAAKYSLFKRADLVRKALWQRIWCLSPLNSKFVSSFNGALRAGRTVLMWRLLFLPAQRRKLHPRCGNMIRRGLRRFQSGPMVAASGGPMAKQRQRR